jgi:hypothetical protein
MAASESHSITLPARLRLSQAAAHLDISPCSLADRGWRLKHRIPVIKVGHAVVFDRAAQDRWVARQAERPIHTPEDPSDGEGGER